FEVPFALGRAESWPQRAPSTFQSGFNPIAVLAKPGSPGNGASAGLRTGAELLVLISPTPAPVPQNSSTPESPGAQNTTRHRGSLAALIRRPGSGTRPAPR